MTGKKIWKMGKAASVQNPGQKPQSMKLQDFSWIAEDGDNVHIMVRTQEEAVVVSADFYLQGTKEILVEALKTEMEHLASQAVLCGGMVGHIKASVECCEVTVISVTLDKADMRRGGNRGLSGKFAAILLLMEETKVRELTEAMFAAVKMKMKEAGCTADSKLKQTKARTEE